MYEATGPGSPEAGRPWAPGMMFYLNAHPRSEVKYGDRLTDEQIAALSDAEKAVVETMLEARVLVKVKAPAKAAKE